MGGKKRKSTNNSNNDLALGKALFIKLFINTFLIVIFLTLLKKLLGLYNCFQ